MKKFYVITCYWDYDCNYMVKKGFLSRKAAVSYIRSLTPKDISEMDYFMKWSGTAYPDDCKVIVNKNNDEETINYEPDYILKVKTVDGKEYYNNGHTTEYEFDITEIEVDE